ncbi:MAG: hypothetical protein WC349_03505 [Patescibacteria group bacterium]|jgi:uncharacterized protein YpuA (DUF1002 family)
MGKKIYDLDISEKITPLMVRDAMLKCFILAHSEALETMKQYGSEMNDQEFEEVKKMNIELFVKKIFEEIEADFNNPKKEDLIKVLDKLAAFSSNFRTPEVIKKHYDEIMELINCCE